MSRSDPTLFLRLNVPPPAALTEPSALARAPALERLLCRADAAAGGEEWRRDAFRLIAAADEPWPGAAAAALHGAFGPVAAGAVYLATPVHYVATLTRVHLAADGVLAVEAGEAARLAADFDATFGPDPALRAGPSGTLFCIFRRPVETRTHDPAEITGRDVGGFQPAGRDAAVLRSLMSEIEMWLHEHPLNRARAARGVAAIGGLWLWGGGAPLERAPRLAGWTGGADPCFAALDPHEEFARDGRSGVVCAAATPGGPAWRAFEARWLAPAVEALAARRLGALVVSAGRRAYRLDRAHRLRFWRRARPWWEYLS